MNLVQERQVINKIKQGLDSLQNELIDSDYTSVKIIANNLINNGLNFAKNSQNLKITQDAYRANKVAIKHGYLFHLKNLYYISIDLIIANDNYDKISAERLGVDLSIPYQGIHMADDCRAFQYVSNGNYRKMIDNIKNQVKKQIKTVVNDLHNILVEISHKEDKNSKMKPVDNDSIFNSPNCLDSYNIHLMMTDMTLSSIQKQPDYTEAKGIKFLAKNYIYVDNIKQFKNAIYINQ